MRPSALAVLLLTVLSLSAVGQSRPDVPTFHSAVHLVYVTVTVTDRNGRFVPGLEKTDFAIHEDRREQVITTFASGRVPASLGILLDASDSMTGEKIEDARTAIESLLSVFSNRDDEFLLYSFHDEAKILQNWTTDRTSLVRALKTVRPTRGTAIYKALDASLPEMAKGHNPKKALVMITDGVDSHSYIPDAATRQALRTSEVSLYVVGIDWHDKLNPLRYLAEESGGTVQAVRTSRDLQLAATTIGNEVSRQYVLGFPVSDADGRWHPLRVEVPHTSYNVRARRGYVR